MEQILKIESKDFDISRGNWSDHYEGYEITTSEQVIHIGVSAGQSCCERFGTIITNDESEDFIGTEIIQIEIVDSALNNKKIEDLEYLDCGDAMFVNLITSAGVLQFVAYNAHNGYYGHEAVLVSRQLTKVFDV